MAVDIYEELYTIKNSIYGSEMRMAIYDALDKVSKASGGSDAGTVTQGLAVYGWAGAAGDSGIMEVEDGI